MEEWTKKDLSFLKIARQFAYEFVTCLSPRKIGSVIVKNGRVISQGVNGPPNNVLHLDERYVKVDDKTSIFGKGWFYSDHLKRWCKVIKTEYNKSIPCEKTIIYIDGTIEIFESFNIDYIPDYSVINHLNNEISSTKDINYQRVVVFGKNDREGEVVSVIKEPTCPRYICGNNKSGDNLSWCACQHSEANAINNCARNGISCDGATLYCYCPLPCASCAGMIINAGISKVVCLSSESDYSFQSRAFFKEAGIKILEIPEKIL